MANNAPASEPGCCSNGKAKDKKTTLWAISQWPEAEAALVAAKNMAETLRKLETKDLKGVVIRLGSANVNLAHAEELGRRFKGLRDKNIPVTAIFLGLWIPNFYYWGLNQYITQRTLGSKSLRQGQTGIRERAQLLRQQGRL